MSVTLRRVASAAALALAASALFVPLAAPARAATPTEKLFVAESVDGDFWTGLYTRPTPTGSHTAVVPDPGSQHIYSISSSADGSRVIYVQINYSATTGKALTWQVVVRDVSTRLVRVLDTVAYTDDWYVGTPQLSPDGTKAVWWLRVHDHTYMRKAAVGYGAFATLSTTLTPYAFLDNTTLLAQDWDGNPYTIPFSAGTAHPVTGLPVNAFAVTVSPDGTKIAYGLELAGGPPYRSTMNVAPVTLVGGVASVGTPTVLSSGAYDSQPAFSRDGTMVYFIRKDGTETGKGDIWAAPADGSTPAAVTLATASDERDVAITTTDDGTLPGPATTLPFTLNGSLATIRWTLPPDADLSGVIVTRTGRSVFVPAPNVALADNSLRVGSFYQYTVTPVDRSGNVNGAPATRKLRAIAPGAVFGNPTARNSTTVPFPVTLGVGGNSATLFWADYIPYGGSLKTWVTGTTGATRTFGAPASANVAATTAVLGGSYRFRTKVQDEFGNASGWAVTGPAVVPYDQTKATFYGGTTTTNSHMFLGTYRRMWAKTQYAKVTLVGNRLQVVGQRCGSCGVFDIYEGTTKIGSVNTFTTDSSYVLQRVVLFTKTYPSNGTHTFTIRPRGTIETPYVFLDAFAMRRS